MKTCNVGIFALVLALSLPTLAQYSDKNATYPQSPGQIKTPEEIRAEFLEKQRLVREQHLVKAPSNKQALHQLPLPSDFRSKRNQFRNLSPKSTDLTGTKITADKKGLRYSSSGVNFSTGINTEGFRLLTEDPPEVVNVTADITTNIIWESDKIYHILGSINVQALLVIEPGTIISFGEGTGLTVNNGGTLVAKGTPDQLITFTSDEPYFGYYFSPIYIEETASAACKISYCLIQGAVVGVATENIHLDQPIQHNFFSFCLYGIGEFGTKLTDILNNQIYSSYYSGMDIYMASATGQEDSDTEILIQNNTCHYYQDTGITVHGVTTSGNAGTVKLENNIVSEAYSYGLNLVDGYMTGFVLCTGYYGNGQNKNWAFDEFNPVTASVSPYDPGPGLLDQCYLKQDSPFIDTGCGKIDTDTGLIFPGFLTEIPQILGFATAKNKDCDTIFIDLGFHYPNFDKVNAGTGWLPGDINEDGTVDQTDKNILQTYYGQSGTHNQGDINSDGIIDRYDLLVLQKHWGQTGSLIPYITGTVNGDPDNISGVIRIEADGYNSDITKVYAFIDGIYVEEIMNFRNEGFSIFQTMSEPNGLHQLKIAALTNSGNIVLSENMNLTFNNSISCFSASDLISNTQQYRIAGFRHDTNNYEVRILDQLENSVWSSGNLNANINLNIPSAVLNENNYDLNIINLTPPSSYIYNKPIFSPCVPDPNAVVLITSPNPSFYPSQYCGKERAAIIAACSAQNLRFKSMLHNQCTWHNVREQLTQTSTKYWINIGHGYKYAVNGNGQPTGLRTNIILADAPVYSYKRADFGIPPLWYQDLGEMFENWAYTIGSLHLFNSNKLSIVFFDCCWSASYCNPSITYHNDMAYALGMYSNENNWQVYLGWIGDASPGSGYDIPNAYDIWRVRLWTSLGGPHSLFEALLYAKNFQYGDDVNYNLKAWGYTQENTLFGGSWWGDGLKLIYFW